MGALALFGGGDGGGILVGQGLPGINKREETIWGGRFQREKQEGGNHMGLRQSWSQQKASLHLAPRDHHRTAPPILGPAPLAPPFALLVIGEGESQ